MADKKKFSQKMEQLENIYGVLKDSDSHSLEEFIDLYKKGIEIARDLESELQTFELEIQHIDRNNNNSTVANEKTREQKIAKHNDTVAASDVDGAKDASTKDDSANDNSANDNAKDASETNTEFPLFSTET